MKSWICPPSCGDLEYRHWQEKGLDKLAKLQEGRTMKIFKVLESQYALQQFSFSNFLQIRN